MPHYSITPSILFVVSSVKKVVPDFHFVKLGSICRDDGVSGVAIVSWQAGHLLDDYHDT